MFAAQTPPCTAESQKHYHGADKETHQIHIHVGTDTIARIRQSGSLGLVHLEQLLNTHDKVPAHLRGCIHLEREGFNLQVASVPCNEEVTAAEDLYALDWHFIAFCQTQKCPTKAAKIKVGGPYENNGMLTLQFLNEFCDHTHEEARPQQRKGVSTAKRKRSGRIAARRKTTTATTAEPQDSLCSPKLEDTDPAGASRILDTQGEGGILTVALNKEIELPSTPVITSKRALTGQPGRSTGAPCRDLETDSREDSPASTEMAKRTRRTGRGASEDATLNKRPTQSTDRPRRSGSTYSRTTRSNAESSSKRDNVVVARQPSPHIQVVIPSFSRVKPDPSHDHDDLPERTSSVSSRVNESRLDTPPQSTDTSAGVVSNASNDPSKDEVLKASGTVPKAPSPSFSSEDTDSTTVKKEIGDDGIPLHSSDSVHQHPAVNNSPAKQPSVVSKLSLDKNRTSCTINSATGRAQPCRIMDSQKRRSNPQRSSTSDSLEKEHDPIVQQEPHEANKYTTRSASGSLQPAKEGHNAKQGGLLTPAPSLTSFESTAQDPPSTSVLSYSTTTSPQKPSAKPQPPPPLTCARTRTHSEPGRLCSVSLRTPKKWLTQVPIAISPVTTFEDLLQYVIQEVEDSIQLPHGMRWSIRSLDQSQQYLLNARVAETISGVEHAALVIMTEQRPRLRLRDF